MSADDAFEASRAPRRRPGAEAGSGSRAEVAPPCQVIVVCATRFYRECLARFLAEAHWIDVVGTARDVAGAAALIDAVKPVIVLIDVSHPSEVTRARLIRTLAEDARVIVLGLPELEEEVLAYAEQGVAGFVGRDRSLEDLVVAIDSASRGELDCSPSVSAALLRHVGRLAAQQRHSPGGAPLTGREYEIVLLIERGLSNKEIAQELHIELATVKNHVHNLLEKLEVASRGQAAALIRTLPLGAVRTD